jgi:signal transduction histidine kinase
MAKCPLILVVGDANMERWVAACCKDENFRMACCGTSEAAAKAARSEPPHIVIYPISHGAANASDSAGLVKRFKNDPTLRACWLLGVYDRDDLMMAQEMPSGHDDLVDIRADVPERRQRLRVGLRVAELQAEKAQLQQKIDLLHFEQQQKTSFLQSTAAELVEMAAGLNAEIHQNAVREVENIRTAQSDLIAQAAAALRHEINNPLFAITGSAETAKRRLELLTVNTGADVSGLLVCIDRIQRGANRIEQVVEAISNLLEPITTDYVPGVTMLDLNRN